MSEPDHSLPQTPPESETISGPFADAPVSSSSGEARIEDYLDHVCAPLVGVVPYERRVTIRAEMRLHLDSLIAAHEELGVAQTEAVEAALRQFGAPKAISKRWQEEWVLEALPVPPKSAWPVTKVALRWYGKTMAVPLLALCAACAFQEKTHLGRAIDPLVGILLAATYLFPLLGGFAVGLTAPSRPLRGTINALAILIPSAVALGQLIMQWTPGRRHYWIETTAVTIVFCTVFIPACCGMAALGRRWRRRRVLKPRRWATS